VRRVLNVAHRGASGAAPENTLAAVRGAVAVGAHLVELDLQRSSDGALMVIHDATLARTTDAARVFPRRAPWRVGDFTHDELKRLDAGGWMSPAFRGETIPTLGEVIAALQRESTGLLLEVKGPERHPGIVRDVASALRERAGYLDAAVASRRLVVQSFGFAAMKEHKTLEPSVPVGLLGTPDRVNLPTRAGELGRPGQPQPPRGGRGVRRRGAPPRHGVPRLDREPWARHAARAPPGGGRRDHHPAPSPRPAAGRRLP
jgi:glycerophosphoryl diester phosphodiesterase